MKGRHRFGVAVLVCFGAVFSGCGGWIDLDGPQASGGTSLGSAGVGMGGQGGNGIMAGGRTSAAAAGHEAGDEGGSEVGGTPSSDGGADPGMSSGGRFIVLEAPPPQLIPEGAEAPDVTWRGTALVSGGRLDDGVLLGSTWYEFKTMPFGPVWSSNEPFVWTEATGLVALDGLVTLGSRHFEPYSVSKDGTTVVGYFLVAQPGVEPPNTGEVFGGFFRWQRGEGPARLGEPSDLLNGQILFVNDAGTVVAGRITTEPDEWPPFLWTQAGGFVALEEEVPGWPSHSDLVGTNEDGTTLVGLATNDDLTTTFRWTAAGGVESLGTLAGLEACYPTNVSRDADIVFGECYSQQPESTVAFVWTEATGMVPLVAAGTNEPCQVSIDDISSDGSVAVAYARCGTSSYALSHWQADTGMVALPTLHGQLGYYDLPDDSLTPDGKVAFGTFCPQFNGVPTIPGDVGTEAVRFVLPEPPVALGFLPGDELSFPNAADSQGTVVAGYSGLKYGRIRAVLWDDQGILDIAADLNARGVDLHDVSLEYVERVTSAGPTIVLQGRGSDGVESYSWLAWLPAR